MAISFDHWLEPPDPPATATFFRECRECGWTGKIEVDCDGKWEWFKCPECGYENEEEIIRGPDPDDQRERHRELREDGRQ